MLPLCWAIATADAVTSAVRHSSLPFVAAFALLLQCHPRLIVTYYVFLLCCCVHCHRLLCCAVASAMAISCCPQGWLLLLSIQPTLAIMHCAASAAAATVPQPVHFLACAALLLRLLPVDCCFLISPVAIVTTHCNVTAHAPLCGNVVAINPTAIVIVVLSVSLAVDCCLLTNCRIFCHRSCCCHHFLRISSCCQCHW